MVLASTLVTAAPYSENFDAGLGTWTQDATDGFDWTLNAGGTPSFNTGPSDDVTGGGNYLFTESSGNYLNNAGITSECFDISALTNPCFSFMYHMFGTHRVLEVYVNGNLEWSLNGDQGDAWTYAQVSLAAYAGTDVTIQIVGTTGTSFSSDMAIDEVGINECAVTGCTDSTVCNFDPWLRQMMVLVTLVVTDVLTLQLLTMMLQRHLTMVHVVSTTI